MTEVAYGGIESPLGSVFAAATPAGVALISFDTSEEVFTADAERFLGTPVARLNGGARWTNHVKSATLAEAALAQMDAYFAGTLRRFDFPLDLTRQSAFQQRVLRAVADIPWGSVLSYGEVAEQLGLPGAARAVGGVMRQNPLPIVVPCHRVVRAGGQLGGFGGAANSLRHKAYLLGLEGIAIDGDLTREALLRGGGVME